MNPKMIEFLEWARYQYRSWNGKLYRLKKRLGIVTNDSNKPSESQTSNIQSICQLREPLFIDFCTYTAGLEALFSRWQLSITQGSFSIVMN